MGRCYATPEVCDKGKGKGMAVEVDVEEVLKMKATDKEAMAFMKVLKTNEYKIIKQVNKTPDHITLAFLLNSKLHHEILLKVLAEAKVPKDITTRYVENVIGSILCNHISFTDDELSSEGYVHIKVLHIVCKCRGFMLGCVMIDNGSAFNACPILIFK